MQLRKDVLVPLSALCPCLLVLPYGEQVYNQIVTDRGIRLTVNWAESRLIAYLESFLKRFDIKL